MKPIVAIEINSPCIGWKRVCPSARRLTREAARVALFDGIATTKFISLARVELGITLTDDTQQRELNSRYRGKTGSTNVLAFRAWEPAAYASPDHPLLLGDVVLPLETVAREAKEQGKPFCSHVRHLIVHGVLHLLGYDHRGEADALAMERLETLILAKLGVPDPYHDICLPIEPKPVFK
jgi:probable rRNA maturation factor